MLADYFALEFDDQCRLCTLPLVLRGYTPALCGLAPCLLTLCSQVEWLDEKRCLNGIISLLVDFYALASDTPMDATVELRRSEPFYALVEQTLLPAMKSSHFFVPQFLLDAEQPCLQLMTRLQDLYRIFERC